jgi:hypothetical protein
VLGVGWVLSSEIIRVQGVRRLDQTTKFSFVHAYGLDEFYDRISFALIGVYDQKVFILYDLACIYLEN